MRLDRYLNRDCDLIMMNYAAFVCFDLQLKDETDCVLQNAGWYGKRHIRIIYFNTIKKTNKNNKNSNNYRVQPLCLTNTPAGTT